MDLAKLLVSCLVLGRGVQTSYNNPAELNQTFFGSLQNYHVNATIVSESAHPWVAKVVHSTTHHVPVVCTASCVRPRVFITAARCLYLLKVSYTNVIYKKHRHQVVAFVVPRNETKQAFDDIGFLVVAPSYKGEWDTVALIEQNRTDDRFKWFDDMKLHYGIKDHKVIGYATRKGHHRIRSADKKFELVELKVIAGVHICTEILALKYHPSFHVPCYYSCSVHDFGYQEDECKRYLGVEGGALIDLKSNRLVGVATWGAYFYGNIELPVGFSVPNSEPFFKNYECALRIRNDPYQATGMLKPGHFQSLCPE